MPKSENILAVDIGNTRVKLVVLNQDKVLSFYTIASKPEIDVNELKGQFNKIQNIKIAAVLISSVVPHNNNIVKKFFKSKVLCPVVILDRTFNLLVKERYGNGKAGMDILCKSAYLISKKHASLCVDCGTATVISYVSKNGYLERVAIAVGYRGMYNALHNDTALIPLYEPSVNQTLLNTNTKDAVTSGNYISYLGALNLLVKTAQAETNCKNVYFTGGYSHLFKNVVNFNHIYDPYLLDRGMYSIYTKNKQHFTY